MRGERPLRTTLTNFGWLSVGRLFGDAATFALLVVVSRWHGEDGLGQYAFAMAFATFFAMAADFGLYPMFIREASPRREAAPAVFGQVFSLGLVLTGLSLAVLLLSLVVFDRLYDRTMVAMILVIGVYQLIYKLVEGCTAMFIVAEKTRLHGLLEVAGKASGAALAAALIVAGASLPLALTALPGVGLVHLALAWGLIVTRIGRPRLCLRPAVLGALVRRAWAYAASAFQVPIYARADVIVLGLLVGTAAVGIYSAAARLVYLWIVVATLGALAVFPLVSRLHAASPAQFAAGYQAVLRGVVLIALPAACGLVLIAPPLIGLIFGPDFAPSAAVLRLLAALMVLFPVRALLATFMMAANLQGRRARIEWLGAAVVWAACLLLVPLGGVLGAALAVVLAEGVMVALMVRHLAPACGWPRVGSRVAISALGIAAFSLPVLVWPGLPWPLVVVQAVVLYGLVLALSADVRATEYRLLRAALAGEPVPPLAPPGPAGRA